MATAPEIGSLERYVTINYEVQKSNYYQHHQLEKLQTAGFNMIEIQYLTSCFGGHLGNPEQCITHRTAPGKNYFRQKYA